MAGGKKAEVEDQDVELGGRTEVTRTRVAPRYRGLTISGGLQVVAAADRCNSSATTASISTPVFPFPQFLFLPALSHGHSSGFLAPSLFYPLCLSPPSMLFSRYTMYAHRVNVSPPLHPSVILCPSSFLILRILSNDFSRTLSRILATMYYARTNRATYIGPPRGVGTTLFQRRAPPSPDGGRSSVSTSRCSLGYLAGSVLAWRPSGAQVIRGPSISNTRVRLSRWRVGSPRGGRKTHASRSRCLAFRSFRPTPFLLRSTAAGSL